MKNVGVFVDTANMYRRVGHRFNGRKISYKAFLDYVEDMGEITYRCAVGTMMKDEASKFIINLSNLNFVVDFTRLIYDQKASRYFKRNLSTQMAVKIIENMHKFDRVVIGSSDIDLEPLVTYLKEKGKEVIILSSGIPVSMRQVATKCIEIPDSLLETADNENPVGS